MFIKAAKTTIPSILLPAALLILFFSSCRSIKDHPRNKPFVYESVVNLEGNFSKTERKQLEVQLYTQIHDSVKARWANKFLLIRQLKNPPVYDSTNADKSLVFIRGMLNSLGYYRDSLNYVSDIDTVGDQQRTSIDFNVVSVSLFRLDSINYNLRADSADNIISSPARDTLQKLTANAMNGALIKKGDPFSIPVLAQEINRLSDVYRNNGFLRFSSEELLVLWDTVGIDLLRPTLDPIEQARQLERLRQRRANPRADVEIRLRSNADSSHLIRYFIGNVRVFPDLNADTALYYPLVDTVNHFQFHSYRQLFKSAKIVDFLHLHPGELYRQSNYLRTQNRFNALPAWRLVTITPYPRIGTDTVDFDIKLTPASKYYFGANVEGSRNQNQLVTGGSLLGLGANLTLQNRNFARAANMAITNLRYGIEFNAGRESNPVETQQLTLSHTIQYPRRIPRNLLKKIMKENVRTILNMNISYVDRTSLYKISPSVNTSWGYEFNRSGKLFSWRFPNIEYNAFEPRAGIRALILENRSYERIFNTGLVLSSIFNMNWGGGRKNVTNVKSLGLEISGVGPSNFIRSPFLDSNLWRFIKFDGEFRQTHTIRRSAFAWRTLLGIGWELPSNNHRNNLYLPFFRQYFGGGPNSMRAWSIRRLGPGSAIRSFNNDKAPDRFGDVRFEMNAEYRFFIVNLNGIILNGALYTDIGNVWFLRKNPDFPNGEFRFNKLWKDIAIGTGTGLRVDFGFLKVRFEYAYKVKDPSPDLAEAHLQNKWFPNWKITNGQFQLGIDYPF
ncbi:MAG: BamA/TamA family outer membrane protein [Flavisolibacter sp.]|jgi:outer membrane protein assembly factor BamA|nr:BamA/TamA family outer membrane protein [Flavisolibacter sp.]